jgi:hypothetical protein
MCVVILVASNTFIVMPCQLTVTWPKKRDTLYIYIDEEVEHETHLRFLLFYIPRDDDDDDGEHLRGTCINVSFLFLDESYTCVCLILVVESWASAGGNAGHSSKVSSCSSHARNTQTTVERDDDNNNKERVSSLISDCQQHSNDLRSLRKKK